MRYRKRNLPLTNSHFFLPQGVCHILLELALTLCCTGSREDCGGALCSEVSLRGRLGYHLEHGKTEKRHIGNHLFFIIRPPAYEIHIRSQ